MTTTFQTLGAALQTEPWFAVVFGLLVFGVFAGIGVMLATSPHLKVSSVEDGAYTRAAQILAEANEISSAMRLTAERDAEYIRQGHKEHAEQLRLEQERNVAAMTAQAKELIDTQTKVIAQLCDDLTADFKAQTLRVEKTLLDHSGAMQKTLVEADERIKQEFVQISVQAKQAHQVLVDDIKKRVADELEKEIEMAKKDVFAYKQERYALLDKEIIGLVEDTARIALHTALSLDDHRGIILAALVEAKQQGVFGGTKSPS